MTEENSVRKEGIRQGILRWYESFHQDKDYAKNLDQTVSRMRKLKLH